MTDDGACVSLSMFKVVLKKDKESGVVRVKLVECDACVEVFVLDKDFNETRLDTITVSRSLAVSSRALMT